MAREKECVVCDIILFRVLSSSVKSLHAISPLDRVDRLRYLLSFVVVVIVNVEEVVVHTNDVRTRRHDHCIQDNRVRDGALATKGAGT